MRFTIVFFSDDIGSEPVKEFLDEVFEKNKPLWAQIISGLEKIKQRAYHREPLSKALGNNLWEIRVRSRSDIARILYTFTKNREIVLLHGFIKKTQKIPKKELFIAKKRLQQLKEVSYAKN